MPCCPYHDTHEQGHLAGTGPVPEPKPDPKPDCNGSRCYIKITTILEMFPNLTTLPRPEPSAAGTDDHEHWLEESEQWASLRCQCGRGYFCREHGDWVSGEEVGSGAAIAADQQQPGCCPHYHYTGHAERDNYVGQRDWYRLEKV